MVEFDIITIFPKIFDSYFNESILKRAKEKKLIKINVHNLRDFSIDKHKKVDDKAFGGGPGMVLKIEPIARAIGSILNKKDSARCQAKKREKRKLRIILFSAQGKKFDNKIAKRLARYNRLIMICGRYEGVDERVAKYIADEEISIGDFILTGGEIPAMVLVDSVSRHIPGVLGKQESLEEIKGSYPVYTRPEVFKIGKKNLRVPKVLLSGDHRKIEEWRENN